VSKLLDDVLIENGLTIPSHRRREFALALLHARLRTLEVSVKRTKGEIAGERQEDQGVTVDGLLDAYLAERKLGSKSEFEVRAAYRRFTAIVGGEKPAKEVDKKDCRAYKASLLAAPSNRSLSKDGKLSPVSVKKFLGICATVFRSQVHGVGEPLHVANPAVLCFPLSGLLLGLAQPHLWRVCSATNGRLASWDTTSRGEY
jgi:hypothetical protein